MAREEYQPTLEGEARLLLLVAAFSTGKAVLEGRTKLAKLDFLARYPEYLERALAIRRPGLEAGLSTSEGVDIETKMVRYRFGPWDPSYFALLGRLMGKGLIEPIPFGRGIGYRATAEGREIANRIAGEPAWEETAGRLLLLKRHFDLAGTTLKKFIYKHFPEVTQARWGEAL